MSGAAHPADSGCGVLHRKTVMRARHGKNAGKMPALPQEAGRLRHGDRRSLRFGPVDEVRKDHLVYVED